jgi:hypothetical protein
MEIETRSFQMQINLEEPLQLKYSSDLSSETRIMVQRLLLRYTMTDSDHGTAPLGALYHD